MVCTCEAYNCGKKREKGQTGISFHQFPKDKDLYKQWLRAIKKDENWKPGSESKVCSRHFTPESYEQGKGRKKLKDDAVPTIFSSSEDSENKPKGKRPAREKNLPNAENEAREEADEAEVAAEDEAPPEAPSNKKGAGKAKNGDVATKEPAKKRKKAK